MRRLLILGGLLGAFLLAPTAFGAGDDGRQCQDASDNDVVLASKGAWIATSCIQLCDGKAAADSTCDDYDFDNGRGMPDVITWEYEDVNGACSSTPDFTITTGPVSGGPEYDLESTAVILNSTINRAVYVTAWGPLDRYIMVDIADDAGCEDVDIRMFLWSRKTGNN